jgi:carbamoyl-phosphate synthase large subunit
VRILFTGGGGAGNEALWRFLGTRYELHFGDADCRSINPIIPADRRHELPWANDPDFLIKIAELCRQLKVDLLIPGVDEELLPVAMDAASFKPTKILLPDAEYVKTMLDKLTMTKILADRGIPIPTTRLLSESSVDLNFPCIAKPRWGRGSRGVRVLNNQKEVEELRFAMSDSLDKMLIQDKIMGTEYTVQMAANSCSRLVAIIPVKVDLKRGITIRAATEAEPQVIAACQKIHEAVPGKGCYNIQLILTPNRDVLPFEINPRISTTFCLTVAAGIDPINIFFGQDHSDTLLPFTPGVQLRRHWTNYISNGAVL